MSARRLILSGLVFAAALLASMARLLAPGSETRPAPVEVAGSARPEAALSPRAPLEPSTSGLDETALRALGDPTLAEQIRRVVASLDATGRPPEGVAQGGRRGGTRGAFQNAEGRLPRRAPGYYVESDVWPRGLAGRGALRLVCGRDHDVYFTSDHYRSFVRLR